MIAPRLPPPHQKEPTMNQPTTSPRSMHTSAGLPASVHQVATQQLAQQWAVSHLTLARLVDTQHRRMRAFGPLTGSKAAGYQLNPTQARLLLTLAPNTPRVQDAKARLMADYHRLAAVRLLCEAEKAAPVGEALGD